jgi:acetyl-CoA carboxylase biotin carboxylase subunit
LLAKLIGYGTDRQQTMGRLIRALNEYFVGGIKTNISLFQRILSDGDFQAGKLDTGFLDRLLAREQSNGASDLDKTVAAIAAGVFAVLDPSAANVNGSFNKAPGNREQIAPSSWKRVARGEGLQ